MQRVPVSRILEVMESLTLEGKEYISSKRAAKISGYTKDYIGQLCRANVLPAKMVGRSWYIEEGALKEHYKTYQGDPVIDSSVWDVDQVEEESGSLQEVASRYVDKQEQVHKQELLNSLFEFKYEKDDAVLFPKLQIKKSEPETGTQIKIERKKTSMSNSKGLEVSADSQSKKVAGVAYKELSASYNPPQKNKKNIEKECPKSLVLTPLYFTAGVLFVVLLSFAFIDRSSSYVRDNDIYVLSGEKISIRIPEVVGKLLATAVLFLDKTR